MNYGEREQDIAKKEKVNLKYNEEDKEDDVEELAHDLETKLKVTNIQDWSLEVEAVRDSLTSLIVSEFGVEPARHKVVRNF